MLLIVLCLLLPRRKKGDDRKQVGEMASRHPSTARFGDPQALIAEHKRFLALKLTKKEESSSSSKEEENQFAPSPHVDKVWHLHLVFPEQYQQDLLAFTKEIKVKPFIVPHFPILSEKCETPVFMVHSCLHRPMRLVTFTLDPLLGHEFRRKFRMPKSIRQMQVALVGLVHVPYRRLRYIRINVFVFVLSIRIALFKVE